MGYDRNTYTWFKSKKVPTKQALAMSDDNYPYQVEAAEAVVPSAAIADAETGVSALVTANASKINEILAVLREQGLIEE